MKRVIVVLAVMLGLSPVDARAQFGAWSAPENLGPLVNDKGVDMCVSVSNSGLSLYFSSNRTSRSGPRDIYVSRRIDVLAPWGPPQKVTAVSSPHWESCPALSLDQLKLYFVSERPKGCGGGDIYVSERVDPLDDFGWGPPVNLGCEADGYVNTAGYELTPSFYADEAGAVVMYFNRAGDIHASPMLVDGTFGPGEPVVELNSPYNDLGAALRHDGLEVIFGSTRPGGLGGFDLWIATRSSTTEPWSEPVHVPELSSPSNEYGRMSFSYDGLVFYFGSTRPGGYGGGDLYQATRVPLR